MPNIVVNSEDLSTLGAKLDEAENLTDGDRALIQAAFDVAVDAARERAESEVEGFAFGTRSSNLSSFQSQPLAPLGTSLGQVGGLGGIGNVAIDINVKW
jgi:hypothetical protein